MKLFTWCVFFLSTTDDVFMPKDDAVDVSDIIITLFSNVIQQEFWVSMLQLLVCVLLGYFITHKASSFKQFLTGWRWRDGWNWSWTGRIQKVLSHEQATGKSSKGCCEGEPERSHSEENLAIAQYSNVFWDNSAF